MANDARYAHQLYLDERAAAHGYQKISDYLRDEEEERRRRAEEAAALQRAQAEAQQNVISANQMNAYLQSQSGQSYAQQQPGFAQYQQPGQNRLSNEINMRRPSYTGTQQSNRFSSSSANDVIQSIPEKQREAYEQFAEYRRNAQAAAAAKGHATIDWDNPYTYQSSQTQKDMEERARQYAATITPVLGIDAKTLNEKTDAYESLKGIAETEDRQPKKPEFDLSEEQRKELEELDMMKRDAMYRKSYEPLNTYTLAGKHSRWADPEAGDKYEKALDEFLSKQNGWTEDTVDRAIQSMARTSEETLANAQAKLDELDRVQRAYLNDISAYDAGFGRSAYGLTRKDRNASYDALVKTLGGDRDKADELVYYANRIANSERRAADQADVKAMISSDNTAQNIAAGALLEVSTLPVNMFSGLATQGEVVKYKNLYPNSLDTVDTSSNWYKMQNMVTDIRNTVSNQISESVGGQVGETLSYLLNTAMSAGDSVLGAAVLGNLGRVIGGAGFTEKGAKLIMNITTLPEFGLNAFASSLEECQERGLTGDKALETAFVSGLVEMGTEVFSLDKFWDLAEKKGVKATKNFVLNYFAQAGIEGSEEIASELLNTAADAIINVDKSEYEQGVRQIMADNPGMTEEEARAIARKNFGKNVLLAGLGGALSAGGTTAVASGINTMATNQASGEMYSNGYEGAAEVFEPYLQSPDKEIAGYAKEGKELADKLAAKEKNGDKITNRDRRRLYNLTNEVTDTEAFAASRPEEFAETVDAYAEQLARDKVGTEAYDQMSEKEQTKAKRAEQKEARGYALREYRDAMSGTARVQNERLAEYERNNEESAFDNQRYGLRDVPEDYRTQTNEATGSEVSQKLSAAKTAEELVAARNEGFNSTVENVPLMAERMYNIRSEQMIKDGTITRADLRAAENTPTDQELYLMGANGQEASGLTEGQQVVYNEGQLRRQNDQAAQRVSDNREIQKRVVDGARYGEIVEVGENAKVQTNKGEQDASVFMPESEAGQRLYKHALNMDTPAAANLYLETLPEGAPVASHERYFDEMYNVGRIGARTFEQAIQGREWLVNKYGKDTLQKIYDQGRTDAGRAASETTGQVSRKGKGEILNREAAMKSPMIRAMMPMLESLAKKTGLDFALSDTLAENIQGEFNRTLSRIVLNVKSDSGYSTLFHELGEFIKAYDQKAYADIRKAILDYWYETEGNQSANARALRMRETYRRAAAGNKDLAAEANKTIEDAADELINDAISGVFATEKSLKAFTDYLAEQGPKGRTLLQKFADFFKALAHALRSLASGDLLSNRSAISLAFAGADRANNIRRLFLEGLESATQAYQQTEVGQVQTEQKAFSIAEDSAGRELTEGQREYFKDSKVVDENGRLKVMYHGTQNEFTVFNFDQGGKNGAAEGFGIYLSDNRDVSDKYGDRLIEGYVNMVRPAYSNQKTMTAAELRKLIEETVKTEAERMADDYDGNVADAMKDTWISNYTYTYDKSMAAAYREVADQILRSNGNDMAIIQEIMNGMGIREYSDAASFYDLLTDITGFDGFITEWADSENGEQSQIALAFRSNQIKNVTNENPTENQDIRYSIVEGMSEEERYDDLKDKIISIPVTSRNQIPKSGTDLRKLRERGVSAAQKEMRKIAKALGILQGGYSTPDIEVEFHYSGRGADESSHQQYRLHSTEFEEMGLLFANIREVLQAAHLLEVHGDEEYQENNQGHKRNSDLSKTYELISAFQKEEGGIVPVKLTIKTYAENGAQKNNLYVAIALPEIEETGIMRAYGRNSGGIVRPPVTSDYKLSDVLTAVKDNPDAGRIREYIPSQFSKLNNADDIHRSIRDEDLGVFSGDDRYSSWRNEEDVTFNADGSEKRSASFVQQSFGRTTSLIEEGTKIIFDQIDSGKMTPSQLVASEQVARKIARNILRDYKSGYDADTLRLNLQSVFGYLEQGKGINYEELVQLMMEVAEPVLAKTKDTVVGKDVYDAFRKNLSTKEVRLNQQQKDEVAYIYGSYGAFKNAMRGVINFNDKATSTLDMVWDELVESAQGVLDPETADAQMPLALADAVEALRPQAVSTWNGSSQDMAYDMALDIVGQYFGAQQQAAVEAEKKAAGAKARQRYSNQLARVRERLKAEKKAYREQVQNRYKERLAKAKEELKGKRDLWKDKYHDTIRMRDEKLAEMAAKNRNALREQRNRRMASQEREEIRKIGKDLMDTLKKPSDKKHILEGMREPIAEFLKGIDFLPARAQEGSRPTVAWRDRMSSLQKVLNDIANKKGVVDDELSAFEYTLDPDIAAVLNNFMERNKGLVKLSDLDYEGVHELKQMLRSIQAAIRNADRMIADEHSARVSDLANGTLEDLAGRDDEKARTAFGRFFHNLTHVSMLDSFSYFEGLGPSANRVYRNIRDGFDRRARHLKEAQEWFAEAAKGFNSKDFRNMMNERTTFKGIDGEVRLSTAQVMSLYALMKRQQARDHIMLGGIKSETYKEKGKTIEQKRPVHFSKTQLQEMFDTLTPEQVQLADAMQQFMSKEAGSWGNRVTRIMYGYDKFGEENYFPIKSDRNSIAVSDRTEQNDSVQAIRNMSSAQATVQGARNALMVGDIFEVFSNHIADMATYDGFVMPLSDAMRWFNYKYKITTNEGGIRVDTTRSVQEEIDRVLGSYGKQYFTNLMKDINGMTSAGHDSQFADKLLSNFKAAAVGANLRVAIQQPTAYMRAMAMMNPKYMMAALPGAVNPRTLIRYAQKANNNSMIAWWKSQGYFETNLGKTNTQIITGQSTLNERIRDVGAKLAELGDSTTWGTIYHAVELEQKDAFRKAGKQWYTLEDGKRVETEAFTRAVVSRFDDIIDHTQVVDSVLHRSQFMRSKSGLAKLESAFQAEPTKSFNMLFRAFSTKKGRARIVATFALTNLLTAAVASAADAFRYNDDDDKSWLERWLEALFGITGEEEGWYKKTLAVLTGNLGDQENPLALIPYVKDAFSVLSGFDSSRSDIVGIENSVKAVQEVLKFVSGDSKKTPYGLVKALSQGFSQLTGVPAYAALREFETAWNTLGDIIGFGHLKTTLESSARKRDYGSLYKAINSGGNITGTVQQLLREGKTVKDIMSGLQTEYKEAYLNADDRTQMGENLTQAMRAMSMTDEEIETTLDAWTAEKEEDVYGMLDTAIADRENIAEAAAHAAETKEPKKITTHLQKYYATTLRALKDVDPEGYQDLRSDLNEALTAIGHEDPAGTLDAWTNGEAITAEANVSEYQGVHDAISSGGDIRAEVQKMFDAGKTERGIKQSLSSTYKPQLLELYKTDKAAATDLKKKLISAYMAAGETWQEANDKINKWIREG